MNPNTAQSKPQTGFVELFLIYLKLGCVSFGGPTAHLAYFKDEFVNRRDWLEEKRYAELLGLCQFVPGPSSSQLGFAIAWDHAGLRGACLAWLAFTLPSALLMIGFASGLIHFEGSVDAIISGLLTAAVAVVAKATLSLKGTLCPDTPRLLIAIATTVALLCLPGSQTQIAMILIGGLLGQFIRITTKNDEPTIITRARLSSKWSRRLLLAFTALLIASFAIPTGSSASIYAAHYQAGSLVFGGGHVVLPLLNDSVVSTGIVTEQQFLAGYSAAQALPGPLFTFAAFLGTIGGGTTPSFLGGLLSLLAIFLPGILLLMGLLTHWDRIRSKQWAQAGLNGANAAVVGLLAAAFINPVWLHGIQTPAHLALATVGFLSIQYLKIPAWLLVLGCALGGYLFL